ncbi:MAG: SH3 domain-containing protein [Chloroflexi bacterium]|nr:SH3 domain-containing protein [Chloroflexota bacterium]
MVRSNSPYNAQCRRIGPAGVGIADLIAQGIRDAVDIWHIVETSILVCFRNQGTLKFLDAATSPRAVSDLASQAVDGMTCGTIDRAGTVVLLQTSEPISAPARQPVSQPVSEPAGDPSDNSPVAPAAQAESAVLRYCYLTTLSNLSLRSGSSILHARLTIIPRKTRLNATFRDGEWYRVSYEELTGWVNGAYVVPGSGCGASVASAVPRAPANAEQAELSGTALSNCALRATDNINLRAGPGLAHEILAQIPYRAEMTATERLEAWYKVEYQGQAGWVNIGFVTRISDCV